MCCGGPTEGRQYVLPGIFSDTSRPWIVLIHRCRSWQRHRSEPPRAWRSLPALSDSEHVKTDSDGLEAEDAVLPGAAGAGDVAGAGLGRTCDKSPKELERNRLPQVPTERDSGKITVTTRAVRRSRFQQRRGRNPGNGGTVVGHRGATRARSPTALRTGKASLVGIATLVAKIPRSGSSRPSIARLWIRRVRVWALERQLAGLHRLLKMQGFASCRRRGRPNTYRILAGAPVDATKLPELEAHDPGRAIRHHCERRLAVKRACVAERGERARTSLRGIHSLALATLRTPADRRRRGDTTTDREPRVVLGERKCSMSRREAAWSARFFPCSPCPASGACGSPSTSAGRRRPAPST